MVFLSPNSFTFFFGGTHVEMVVPAEHMVDNNERDETHTNVKIENLRLIRSIADDLVEQRGHNTLLSL